MPTTIYVAETNGNNQVCALWVKRSGQTSAKPFDPTCETLEPTDHVDICGASQAAIKQWVAVQKSLSTR